MRGGQYHANHGHTALTDIGVNATPGGYAPEFGIVRLHEMYRPAKHLDWHHERGWTLAFEGREWGDWIVIGPPEMTPGKAARACARLLTEQTEAQIRAVQLAVQTVLGEDLEELLGWETVADLRKRIGREFDADVLVGQDGGRTDG